MSKLWASPHRIGFFTGSVVLLASLAWWALLMLQRFNGDFSPSQFPSAWLHADLMIFGFLPLFMMGFINTAGPKWLGVEPPRRAQWIGSTASYALGSFCCVLASAAPELQSWGDALHFVGWAWMVGIWATLVRQSRSPDRRHAWTVLLAFSLGLPAMLAQCFASSRWVPALSGVSMQLAVIIGIWGFLVPVFLTVCHRMIPFFSSVVLQPYVAWRPFWLLYSWIALSLLHGALAILAWYGPQISTAPVDIVFGGLLLWTSYQWKLARSFRVPLLAMLHASFLWAGVSMIMFALQAALAWFGVYRGGLAPLHALTIGFLTTMLMAFATRVSLGHSGRALVIGRLTWVLYWVVHAVAITRIAADCIPAQAAFWVSVAAVLGLISFALWASRFMPMYWKVRADGQPG
jgi:uncharacterized protein involved in response to NO